MTRKLYMALALCTGCVVALLQAQPLQAAAVNLCTAESGSDGTEMYGPDGSLLRLAVNEVAASGCVALELPLPATAVRWFALSDIPAADAPPERLALQGFFDADGVRISEIIRPQAELAEEPGFLPFNTDVQPLLETRAFGVEERAQVDGRLLTCSAGTRSAGITLDSALLWEQLPGMELEISARGSGEFAVAIADAARARAENPLRVGTLAASEGSSKLRYALPANAERWTQLVILCPAQAAELTLESLRFVTQPLDASVGGRATWLWSPQLWHEQRAAIWQLAEQEQLDKVYVTVPLDRAGNVADAAQLASFITEAADHGIAVWAVAGDRSDVLPRNLPGVVARAEAYRRFNTAHPAAQLGGLQLDIEPYLLPGSALAPDYWRERYVATIAAVHAQLAGELPLDLAMPVWWGTHPAWGSRLLDALALPGLSITVMNYRTNADALRAGAMPFLAWGRARGHAIAMALEKGRIGVNARDGNDETRASYVRAAYGELWLLELAGMSLLLLLDGDYANLPGQAYALVDTRTISTATISFANAPANLQALAATLAAEWSAWDSFNGLAIHGLDQDLQGR